MTVISTATANNDSTKSISTNNLSTNNASNSPSQPRAEYFNLNVTGIGYLNNIRKVSGNNGEFTCAVINALTGPTDNASYTRFDITVAGKESVSLINRCQKAVDEEKQVLIGFVLSGLVADVFTLTKGDHAGESRPALKARLIVVEWVKISGQLVYKSERPTSMPPAHNESQHQSYAENSF
ncbi:STY4534 family ICE replication protein [Yersinia enterocolitica]|uniref:STY4534 family ICE replication protein n=1 Tax=Yersinia enterocolitica TaxID=630 RepID=UPI00398D3921